jgi:CRP-like cAMP-binding protein
MDVAAKLELLRHIPYFRSLPQTLLQRLATSLRERCYQPGDVIFRKGDQSEGLGVVLRGRVRTVTTSPEGREQVAEGTFRRGYRGYPPLCLPWA